MPPNTGDAAAAGVKKPPIYGFGIRDVRIFMAAKTKRQRETARGILLKMMLLDKPMDDIAEATGFSLSWVEKTKKALKEEWAAAAADGAAIYQESVARYRAYELMAIETGDLKEARMNREALVKLTGAAQPEKYAIQQSGDQVIRLEFVNAPSGDQPEIRRNPAPPADD